MYLGMAHNYQGREWQLSKPLHKDPLQSAAFGVKL